MTIYNETMSGGSLINGLAIVNFFSGASAIVSGDSVYYTEFLESASDGAVLGGRSNLSKVFNFIMSDGALVDGQSYATHTFNIDQNILFAIDQQIYKDIGFYWSVGELPYYWYVVEGYVYPNEDTTCVGVTVPEKQNFIQTILARTPKEVCEIFSRQDVTWQIVYMKRWSQPADPYLWNPNIKNCLVPLDYKCPAFVVSTRSLIKIGFTSEIIQVIKYIAVVGDSPALSGAAETIIASGGTTPTTGSFEYFGGGKVFTGGEAEAGNSFDKNYFTYIGSTTIVQSEFVFGLGEALAIVAPTNTVSTSCGTCIAFPLELFIQNNFVKGGVLYNFLQRNALTLPTIIKMLYSSRSNSWIGNVHLQGTSYDNINQEAWRFQFEFGCTTAPFTQEESTGTPVFKFSAIVTQKNLFTNMTLDTRIILVFSSSDVCNTVRNFKEDFIFDINTKTNFVSTPNGIFPSTVLLSDKIGIFLAGAWNSSPKLSFRISATNVLIQGEKKDITPIIPTTPNLIQFAGGFNTSDFVPYPPI